MMIQGKKAVFFKEYPCYDFSLYDQPSFGIKHTFQAAFKSSLRKLQSSPPAAIVDAFSSKERLYLLQWLSQEKSVRLFLRALDAQEWIQVRINLYPDYVEISNGSIFVIAGNQLFIFSLKSHRSDKYTLPADQIMSVHPWLFQNQAKDQQFIYDTGLYILFSTNQGTYFPGLYSLNRQQVKKPNMFSKLVNLFQRMIPTIHHLEVIIPNVLGLAFMDYDRIAVFNLETMQVLEEVSTQFIVKIKSKERPLVRWKRHQMVQYNQTLLISIGIGSFIFTFFLMMNYSQQAQKLNLQKLSLTDFVTGNLINWSQVSLKPYLTFALEGNLLVDFTISKKGLIYLSKEAHSDLIGQCKYIDMNHLLNQYPIVMQQSTIWKLYYEDISEQYRVDEDRLLIPNRYPYKLVKYLQENTQSQSINDHALTLWRHHYKFRSFLTFEEELLIVRSGSLSVFRNVQPLLFNQEYLSYQQLQIIQPQCIHERYKNLTEEGKKWAQDFESSRLQIAQKNPLISERSYKSYTEDERQGHEHIDLEIRNQRFNKGLRELQQIIEERHRHLYHSLNTPNLQFNLICQQLKDKISYFHLIFTNNAYNPFESPQREFNKLYEKNSFIAKLFQYFYMLNHRSEAFYSIFGEHIISLFVQEHQKILSDDIDASVNIILQKMTTNLIPKVIKKERPYELFTNGFLQFLVSQLQQSIDHSQHQKVVKLREQLIQILKIGFLENKSSYFSEFWTNNSLFKVLLLSNQEQLVEELFPQYLLLTLKGKEVLFCYSKIKKYMLPNIVQVVEKHLFINQAKHNLKVDINQLNFENWINQDNVEVAALFQQLNSQILQKQMAHEDALVTVDNMEEIKKQFESLFNSKSFNFQTFRHIKYLINSATIPDFEDKLQFFEEILAEFVKLFNDRIDKDHQLKYYNDNHADTHETIQFKVSRENLRSILDSISSTFAEYKNCYDHVYGKEINKTFKQKVLFQEKLMTQMFIERKIRLIDNQKGLVVSRLSLYLLQRALVYSELRNDDQYNFSLKSIPNLLCFWLRCIRNVPIDEVAFTYEYLTRIDTEKVIKDFLSHLNYDDYFDSLERARKVQNDDLINTIVWQVFETN